MSMKSWFGLGLLLALLACGACGRSKGATPEVTLAVAASLRGVLPALEQAYTAGRRAPKLVATFGGSGDLKKQVEGGAPIDGVIFAAARPVDELAATGRVVPMTRRVLATNRLILIGPKGAAPRTFASLGALPPKEMVAIGDPGAVPAGQYARDYLKKLGVWDSLQGRLVLGGDVSAVLAYARRGEVAAAVVYATEIMNIPDVTLLDEAKGPLAPRAEVVAAAVSGARGAQEASDFFAFIASPAGQKILAEYGFGPP